MDTFILGIASLAFGLLVVSGHALAQDMRGDAEVTKSRLRMPRGGAADIT